MRAATGGRNVPLAMATGISLIALVVASIMWRQELFIFVAAVAVALAMRELAGAFRRADITLPLVPLQVGVFGVLMSTYWAGAEGLMLSLALTIATAAMWRLFDGGGMAALRDVAATAFAAIYLPFCAGFVILLLAESHGDIRVLLALFLPAANDTGGFFIGSRFGRHPIAPRISPKKSWEGAMGSLLFAAAVAAGGVYLLKAPWWTIAPLAFIAVIVGTLGDFCESLIKRELALKDMGTLLPGHGGIMDRLDSVLLCAPALYIFMTFAIPVTL